MTSASVPPSKLAPAGGASWRFEPIAWVGSGATADVWRARDNVTRCDVALKVARAEASVNVLAAEAERLSWALSPHLPELIEVGRVPDGADGRLAARAPFIAMSWVDGRALDPSGLDAEDRLPSRAAAAPHPCGGLA